MSHPSPPVDPGGSGDPAPSFSAPSTSAPTTPSAPSTPATAPAKPALEVLTEQVYVLMKDYDGGDWICTGSLVANNLVVTAAHCLDDSQFASFEIVAPLLPDKPRVSASTPHLRSYDYESPASPDIGFLVLDQPIEAPNYAVLTDVSDRIEKGEQLEATTIVRSAEEAEAPFKSVDNLKLQSTTAEGYDHGFGAPMYSHGGDSGAGLFLVENGQVTHKLIGVERQPDPDTNMDQLTRIDKDFLDWYSENK